MRFVRRLLVGATVLAAGGVAAAGTAGAIVEGNCVVTVQGVDAAPLPVDDPAHAIKVPQGGTVTYRVSSPTAVRSRQFVMSFAGVDVVVDRGSSSGDRDRGGSRGDTVAIDDYAWMGAGLYQVAGVARLANGSKCTGAVLIEVQGNPLGTAAGITALILTALGGAGIIVGAIRRGGGRQVRDLIDFIELSGISDTPAVAGAATTGTASTSGETTTSEQEEAPTPPTEAEKPAEQVRRVTRRTAPGPNTTPPGPPVAPVVPVPPAAVPEAAAQAVDAAPPAAADLPGMAAVAAVGASGKALTEAAGQIEGEVDALPISDEEKDKIKQALGVEKIKETLEAVTEVTETIEHFEGMATDTVDKLNRWGVNANGINGLVWLRTMAEASGRIGQKFTDGIVAPVIEPITEAAQQVGIEADAGEIAHTLLPVQVVAEEGSKALLTAAKNVLGGDNVLDQLGQDPVVDEEWRNIRTFE